MGPESRVLLQQVLQASDSHVRMRGLHLLMSAAAQRPGNVQALRSSGDKSWPSLELGLRNCMVQLAYGSWTLPKFSQYHLLVITSLS